MLLHTANSFFLVGGVSDSIEPVATISQPLKDIKCPEKEKVMFACEVSRANADVKWFKVRYI